MGYESKIYVVEKFGVKNNNGKQYGQVIAMYDMCKFGDFCDIFKTTTDCFIYADDGDTEITKDKYDMPLMETSINVVIEYLENYVQTQDYYRRINPLLEMLKAIKQDDWKDIVVLHYGY